MIPRVQIGAVSVFALLVASEQVQAQQKCAQAISQPAAISAAVETKLLANASENGAIVVDIARKLFYPALSRELQTAFMQDYASCVTEKYAPADAVVMRVTRRISDAFFEIETIAAEDKPVADRLKLLAALRKSDLDTLQRTSDTMIVKRARLDAGGEAAAKSLFEPLAAMGLALGTSLEQSGQRLCLQLGKQAIHNASLADINAVRQIYTSFTQLLRGVAREDVAMQQIMMSVYSAAASSLRAAAPPAVVGPNCKSSTAPADSD